MDVVTIMNFQVMIKCYGDEHQGKLTSVHLANVFRTLCKSLGSTFSCRIVVSFVLGTFKYLPSTLGYVDTSFLWTHLMTTHWFSPQSKQKWSLQWTRLHSTLS
eukprot:14839362-Ditylum_brightwellii.AAC.2